MPYLPIQAGEAVVLCTTLTPRLVHPKVSKHCGSLCTGGKRDVAPLARRAIKGLASMLSRDRCLQYQSEKDALKVCFPTLSLPNHAIALNLPSSTHIKSSLWLQNAHSQHSNVKSASKPVGQWDILLSVATNASIARSAARICSTGPQDKTIEMANKLSGTVDLPKLCCVVMT